MNTKQCDEWLRNLQPSDHIHNRNRHLKRVVANEIDAYAYDKFWGIDDK